MSTGSQNATNNLNLNDDQSERDHQDSTELQQLEEQGEELIKRSDVWSEKTNTKRCWEAQPPGHTQTTRRHLFPTPRPSLLVLTNLRGWVSRTSQDIAESFRYSYLANSHSYVLTKGWSRFDRHN